MYNEDKTKRGKDHIPEKSESQKNTNEGTMDEFITAIKNNIGATYITQKSPNKLRELLQKVISSTQNPVIEITERCSEEGDIKFTVSKEELGLPFESLLNYKEEIFSDFFVNFMGEFLIRENINKFASILMGVDKNIYPSIVNKYEHKKFGLQIWKNKFVFSFHISLIEHILTEDLKKQIKQKL